MAKQLQITDRDIAMLAQLGELGIMSTDMIYRGHYAEGDAGPKYCQRRLRDLGTAGYIESSRFPTVNEKVHRLTAAGADVVAGTLKVRPRRIASEKPLKAARLPHRLGVVRTRLALDAAAQQAGLPPGVWIMEQDTYPDASFRGPAHDRFILSEVFRVRNERVTCRPDAAVLWELPERWFLAAYIEYDLSTEGHKQIIETKVDGYSQLFAQQTKPYRRHWANLPQEDRDFPRVLFICRSTQRIDALAKSLIGRPGAEYFRFAPATRLDGTDAFRAAVWRTVDGQAKAILPPSPATD